VNILSFIYLHARHACVIHSATARGVFQVSYVKVFKSNSGVSMCIKFPIMLSSVAVALIWHSACNKNLNQRSCRRQLSVGYIHAY